MVLWRFGQRRSGINGESGTGQRPQQRHRDPFLQTAAPIRQALVKRQYGAEAGTSPEASTRLDRVKQVYGSYLNVPGFTLGSAQGDRKGRCSTHNHIMLLQTACEGRRLL